MTRAGNEKKVLLAENFIGSLIDSNLHLWYSSIRARSAKTARSLSDYDERSSGAKATRRSPLPLLCNWEIPPLYLKRHASHERMRQEA